MLMSKLREKTLQPKTTAGHIGETDHYFKKELRSFNRELQLHILELADVLVERPSQYARQARATLIHILELQIQRRKEALEDIKKFVPKNIRDVAPN
ncbi:mediator of RNA polymerase II transcription subunit 7a isoform X2 [Gossypium australe]|uniref:Mediator of RNA polymerase II transcription subunit 7a isoform X2 n=1 Tax=Gossypium australe TaxID=47621 RepID=A0A5B6UYR7_9ROSI|nr:mediator of RNA polymerase II transcription subunit 7a isoform X2 [Gossypium australe]